MIEATVCHCRRLAKWCGAVQASAVWSTTLVRTVSTPLSSLFVHLRDSTTANMNNECLTTIKMSISIAAYPIVYNIEPKRVGGRGTSSRL